MINIIHQIAFSGDDLDGYTPPNIDNIKEFLPSAEYHFWDLPRFTQMLKDDGATDVLKAINNIKPYAYKADIARYYIIHKTGGWYMDQNNYFTAAPQKYRLSDKELVVFAEVQGTSNSSWAVQNSVFYADKGHEVLQKSVDRCIENVENKYYGFGSTCPTGPNVFGSAIASQRLGYDHKQVFGKFLFYVPDSLPKGFYLNSHKKPFVLYKPNHGDIGIPTGESKVPGGNNHYNMWHDRVIY